MLDLSIQYFISWHLLVRADLFQLICSSVSYIPAVAEMDGWCRYRIPFWFLCNVCAISPPRFWWPLRHQLWKECKILTGWGAIEKAEKILLAFHIWPPIYVSSATTVMDLFGRKLSAASMNGFNVAATWPRQRNNKEKPKVCDVIRLRWIWKKPWCFYCKKNVQRW